MVMNKSKSAFKTIAEAAEDLGVATHVLRFWETKFPQIQPMKTNGKRRYYRPDDMEILRIIKDYLYEKRYTIEGVQKIFKSNRLKDIIGGTIQSDFFDEDAGNVPSADELISQIEPQTENTEPQVVEKVVEKVIEKRIEVLPETKIAEIKAAKVELQNIKSKLDSIINKNLLSN